MSGVAGQWWLTPLIHPSTWEAEARGFLSLRPAWSTEWVPGQPKRVALVMVSFHSNISQTRTLCNHFSWTIFCVPPQAAEFLCPSDLEHLIPYAYLKLGMYHPPSKALRKASLSCTQIELVHREALLGDTATFLQTDLNWIQKKKKKIFTKTSVASFFPENYRCDSPSC